MVGNFVTNLINSQFVQLQDVISLASHCYPHKKHFTGW